MTQPQFYVVGGAVRDAILGVKPTDIDYLVVGATPEWMLANGYTQVGADFPVFLKNGEEYALARTERKTGAGYHGFVTNSDPSITLEQDLKRRDLTINSMAVELAFWPEFLLLCEKYRTSLEADFLDEYVHNWTDHIFNKAIMMNSGAFKEDPVRVFRAVRMCHTLPKGEGCHFVADDWDYGARTWAAMKEMVESDDFKGLTPERIAQEIIKTASKCSNMGQFDMFMGALTELGAMPFVIEGGFWPFPETAFIELEDYVVEGGLTDRHAVAYMMLCMRGMSPKMMKDRFKQRRYSTDAINFGNAVSVLENSYGNNSSCAARGHFVPATMLEIVGSVSRNEFSAALKMVADLQLVAPGNIELLLNAFDILCTVGIESLTPDQQQTLTGRDIGAAIQQVRINKLDQVMQARVIACAE